MHGFHYCSEVFGGEKKAVQPLPEFLCDVSRRGRKSLTIATVAEVPLSLCEVE